MVIKNRAVFFMSFSFPDYGYQYMKLSCRKIVLPISDTLYLYTERNTIKI